jgi:hypothetical protein
MRLFVLAFLVWTVLYGTGIRIDAFEIVNRDDGTMKIHVDYTAYGLNTPIPESDEVYVYLEVKKDDGGSYAQLPRYFNYMKNCDVDASDTCIKKSEQTVIYEIGDEMIRPPSVWLHYGGLDKWGHNAPDTVKGSAEKIVPIMYEGAQARLVATLRHTIGGPYAAWLGISYYHAVEPITVPYKIQNNRNNAKEKTPDMERGKAKKLEISVFTECEGYKDVLRFIEIADSSAFSKVVIKGVVQNMNGQPLNDCHITAETKSSKVDVRSGKDGTYTIDLALTDGKGGMDAEHIDFYMEEEDIALTVKVLKKPVLFADGRLYKVKVAFLNHGKPYAGKTLYLNYPADSKAYKGKKEVNYIDIPEWFSYVTTDERGIADIFILAPKSNRDILNNVLNANRFFPVDVSVHVYHDKNGKPSRVGNLNLSWQSPYPKIEKAVIPGNMEAQHWQIIPSKIYVDAPNSKRLRVEVWARGRLKTKGGKIHKNYLRIDNISTMPVEFYFASMPLGLDLNEQTDLAEALKNATRESALNFLLTLIEAYGLRSSGKSVVRSLYTGKFALDIVSLDTIRYTPYVHKGIKDADTAVGGVLGLADFFVMLKGKSFSLRRSLYIEFAKTLYAYSKTIVSTYYQARKIENAYQDVIFIPILIKVTDENGYQTAVLKKCGVRFYQGE